MDLGLRGRTAIVCAASAGLGKAAAQGLAAEGANLVICSRDEGRIRGAAEEIRSALKGPATDGKGGARSGQAGQTPAPPPEILPVVADVSRAEDIRSLIAQAAERFGRIDILVTNAGGPPVAGFLDLDEEKWASGVQLTLFSVVRLVREVLPHMQKRKWGRIVNITSIAAKQPIDDLVISSALRPGILGLTKVLANRYGHEGVLFNSVAPGFILTGRQEEILQARSREMGITREEFLERTAGNIPMKRLGRPEELADAIVFLCSERASYIQGATISVDGGLTRGLL